MFTAGGQHLSLFEKEHYANSDNLARHRAANAPKPCAGYCQTGREDAFGGDERSNRTEKLATREHAHLNVTNDRKGDRQ